MTDRVEHSTLPVGFKLGAPRGLLLQSLSWRLAEGFNEQPESTTTPYHSKGTRTRSVPSRFHDGSYWRVLTVHIASLEVRKGSIAPFGTPSSNDAICAFETFEPTGCSS